MKNKFLYFLVILGVSMIAIALLANVFGVENNGIGAAELFVIDIGAVFALIGAGFLFSRQENEEGTGWFSRQAGRIPNLPNITWIVAGFFIAYLIFVIYPIFLASPQRMVFFNKFIPTTSPIGTDFTATIKDIGKWFSEGNSQIFYPPLVNIIFAPFLLVGFPVNYYIMTSITAVSYFILCFALPSLIAKKENHSVIVFIAAISVFSYGLQFEMERGQFHTTALMLSVLSIYLFHKYPSHRFFAYLLFCISVQFKVYPALFFVMFVDDWRDWKNNIKRFVALGITNFLLLFLLGFSYFSNFISHISADTVTPIQTWNGNHSIASFTTYLSFSGIGILGDSSVKWVKQNIGLIESLLLIYFVICLLIVWINAYRRNTGGFDSILFLTCVIGGLIIPSVNHDYTLPLLTAPFALVAAEQYSGGSLARKITVILLLVISSFTYTITLVPFSYKPEYLQNSFPLILILLSTTVLLSFLRTKEETEVGETVTN